MKKFISNFFLIVVCLNRLKTQQINSSNSSQILSEKIDPHLAKITKLIAIAVKIGAEYLKKPIIIGLFGDETPKTVKNFYDMCTNSKLEDRGLKLSYLNSNFHKIIPYSIIQGGDITRGNGNGGWSIYGPEFDDENFNIAHDVGVIAMVNKKKNGNNSQFFINTEKNESFNGKFVAFGIVVQNMDVVYLIEKYGSQDGTPKTDIMIVDCYDPTLV